MEVENLHSTAHKRSRFGWIAVALLAFFAVATVVIVFAIYHAEPILRSRIVETLSTRFQSRVELAGLHVSVAHGLQVSGERLRIFGKNDVNIQRPGVQPILVVDEFRFSAGALNLLRAPMRVHRVYLKGLELNIPPREQRGVAFGKAWRRRSQ